MNRLKESYQNIKTASKHLANVAKIVTGSKKPTKRVNRLERLKLQATKLISDNKKELIDTAKIIIFLVFPIETLLVIAFIGIHRFIKQAYRKETFTYNLNLN